MKQLSVLAESVTCLPAAIKVRVAARRALRMVGFLAILGAALSGYAGVGIWAIAAAATALAALSQAEYTTLYQRGRELGLTDAVQSTVLQSLVNALMATTSAYVMGLVFRLL